LLRSYVRAGLKLGQDVRVIGKPDFGSEPYLIEIGDHVTMSSNVTFITHDGATWVFRHLPPYLGMQRFGRIVIGDNCFIGANAIIMPGVSIGSNSVVGAGAVVTRSVPANSVVAGVPARYVCSYEQYVERMIPRCRVYPPDVTADRKKLKEVLLSAIPYPAAEETQPAGRSGSAGET
jgi:acetyltransferase-like isoleucine patch superfamily enzyme